MKFKIFVDGQFGTTGLKIHKMLANRSELEVLKIKEEDKKDLSIKQKLINEADLVFLCLPDVASKQSVKLITNETTKVIDASTAHRTNDAWTYGIPELNKTQREEIQNSTRVSVPGCHASGFIIAMNPLIQRNIISPKQKLICNSITGYSGGGKGLIDIYEANDNEDKFLSQRPYALNLDHKHLPEMKYILGLDTPPLFTPSVGNFSQGMLVMSYLIKSELLVNVSKKDILDLYKEYYKNENFVKIIEEDIDYLDEGFLDAMKCNNTNRIEISVYENDDYMVIISRLDNLGKGASGAAVQNMNIMLGLEENLGLKV
ncbi:MAG: N-acetyl-gamma-glutamyl-phosphate reductase [Campylobacteraceae bacterium]|nr:N-acetyl-gamma-glutamyl-phosphate reductase [Campylobacteraceae bacterium]